MSLPFIVALVVGGVWACWTNLVHLGYLPVASDEPAYATAGWSLVHANGRGVEGALNYDHPPLAKYLFGIAQLFAGHPSVVADRAVAALCSIATALIIGLWLGFVVDRWTGLGAGLLVAVVPMHIRGLDFRFGRYGMLDPVAEMFMAASVVLVWVWSRHTGRRAWLWATATGAAVGLAAASKENGWLGAVGPVIFVVALTGHQRGRLAERAGQALAAAACSLVVFAGTYVLLPRPWHAFRFMVTFQTQHSTAGHLVGFDGRVTASPPWWAFFWFVEDGLGRKLLVVTLACVAAALVLRRDRLTYFCLAALIAPLAFHAGIAGVVLSFYWVLWMPFYLALVALGIRELVRPSRTRHPWLRTTGVAVGMVCSVALAAISAHETVRTTNLTQAGPANLPGVMRQNHLHGPIIASALPDIEFFGVSVPGGHAGVPPKSLVGIDTVVAGEPRCRAYPSRYVEALVHVNVAAARLHEVYADRRMTVYAATGQLLSPSDAQVLAERRFRPGLLC